MSEVSVSAKYRRFSIETIRGWGHNIKDHWRAYTAGVALLAVGSIVVPAVLSGENGTQTIASKPTFSGAPSRLFSSDGPSTSITIPATTSTTERVSPAESQYRAQIIQNVGWNELGTDNVRQHETVNTAASTIEVLSYVKSHKVNKTGIEELVNYYEGLAKQGIKLSGELPEHGTIPFEAKSKTENKSTVVIIPNETNVPTWAEKYFTRTDETGKTVQIYNTGSTFIRNGQRVLIIRVGAGYTSANGILDVELCQGVIDFTPDPSIVTNRDIIKLGVQELGCNVLGQKARGRQGGLSEDQVNQTLTKVTIRTFYFPNGIPAQPLPEVPYKGIPTTQVLSLV